MKIVINEMEIKNFKGIRNLNIKFGENVTNIYGGNGTGKTSIFDAFLWLLFGKDSKGRGEFAIKTLDKNGNEIPKLEHSVKGIFSIDGQPLVLKRGLRDKWVKQRGTVSEVFCGNEGVFEINNVIVKQYEYNKRIADIIDEDVFKLITNPAAFAQSKWQSQRKILMDMAELGSDGDIALRLGMADAAQLIGQGSADEKIKELAASKKKIVKARQDIEIRIDEICRNMSAGEDRQEAQVVFEIQCVKEKINAVQDEIRLLTIGDRGRTQAELNLKNAKVDFERAKAEHNEKTAEIKSKSANEIYLLDKEIRDLKYKADDCERILRESRKKLYNEKGLNENLRREYLNISSEKFNDTVCPACGREWDSESLNEKKEAFNKNKTIRLLDINERLGASGNEINLLENAININQCEAAQLKEKISQKENEKQAAIKGVRLPELDESVFLSRIEAAERQVRECRVDTGDREDEISGLNAQLESLERELCGIRGFKAVSERINQLKKQENDYKNAQTEIERNEEILRKFNEDKINLLDRFINSRFGIVKFKLFDYQINGGYAECCVANVDGVPYRDLNTAAKINAGIDIINVLQEYYDICAPVFVDNRESVNRLERSEGQVVCLSVSEAEELRIDF